MKPQVVYNLKDMLPMTLIPTPIWFLRYIPENHKFFILHVYGWKMISHIQKEIR